MVCSKRCLRRKVDAQERFLLCRTLEKALDLGCHLFSVFLVTTFMLFMVLVAKVCLADVCNPEERDTNSECCFPRDAKTVFYLLNLYVFKRANYSLML